MPIGFPPQAEPGPVEFFPNNRLEPASIIVRDRLPPIHSRFLAIAWRPPQLDALPERGATLVSLVGIRLMRLVEKPGVVPDQSR